jgi:hypothetical protein
MPTEILYSVIGFLVTVVVALIAMVWSMHSGAAARAERKFDGLTEKLFAKLDELTEALHGVESGLRGELSNLDRRVTRLEAVCPCRPKGD